MKFVHIADMHFDTPFTLLSDRANLGDVRRLDQRNAFKKMINYIKNEEIPYLFIAGDFYDNEYIRESTIEFINNEFKKISNTKVYIVPGNHDPKLKNSYYNKYNWNDNVMIFSSKLEMIENEEFDLYAYGFDDFYMRTDNLNSIKLKENKINILLTHTQLNGVADEKQYNPIVLNELKNICFDYVAIGHIHKREIINNNIVYPGSTVSLGFDELGKHGMIVGDLDKEHIDIKFIELDDKEFKEIEFDISELYSVEELLEKIQEINIANNEFYKIILVGNKNFEINTHKLISQIEEKNILKIKDKSKIAFDLNEISNNITLKGIFVKEMLTELGKKEANREMIERAIEIGLDALS